MTKKSLRIGFALVLIVLLAFGAWQYFKKGIELKKVTADLHFVGQDQLKIDMRLNLGTRFFWETKIFAISYQLKLADRSILEGTQNFDTLVIDNRSSTIPLELVLDTKELRSTIDSLQITDSTYLQLEYYVDYQLPIIGRRQTKNTTLKKIEVPIPPKITLEELKTEGLKLYKSLNLLARIKVVNQGNVALSINDLNYSLEVENEEWASGKLTEPISIESKSEQIFDFPIEVSPEKVGKRLWQRFVQRDSIKYSIKANGRLDLKVKKLDIQNIDFELDGVY